MNICFVIQPFDKGNFDDRYNDIFEPAIKDANLEPYRVDKDYSVRIPIDSIEEMIRQSRICFAEITTDNPNVWYELGYAFACGKDVVIVCSDERQGKFPFDIQHRHIITYKTGSASHFAKLKIDITEKLNAFLQRTNKEQNQTEGQLNENHVQKQRVDEYDLVSLLIEKLDREIDRVYFNYGKSKGSERIETRLTGIEALNEFTRQFRHEMQLEKRDFTFKQFYQANQILSIIHTYSRVQKKVDQANLSIEQKNLFKEELNSFYNLRLHHPLKKIYEGLEKYPDMRDNVSEELEAFYKGKESQRDTQSYED